MNLNPKDIAGLHSFRHGFAVFYVKKGRGTKGGVVHSDGRIRIEPKFDLVGISQDRKGRWLCNLMNSNSGDIFAVLDNWKDRGRKYSPKNSYKGLHIIKRKGGYYGVYLNTPDNIVLEPTYRRIYIDTYTNRIHAKNSKNKCGVLSLRGRVIVPFEHDMIRYAGASHYIAYKKTGNNYKNGLMDRKGRVLIPVIYDELYPINDNYLQVGILGKDDEVNWKLIDVNGNEIQSVGRPLEIYNYCDIRLESNHPDSNILDVRIFDDYGCVIKIDETEKTYHYIIPVANNNIYSQQDGKYIVQRRDTMKYGLVSSKGKGLIPCEYDYMEYGDDSELITVRKGDEWFCINSRNERVLF